MLSRDTPVKDICSLMGVSRSGYYKWLRREGTMRDFTRDAMLEAVERVHSSHPSHGYRWVAAYIRNDLNCKVSDSLIYKCWRHLGYKSQTKHQVRHKPRKIRDKYPNLILSSWDTVDRPRQVIVSDMTFFKLARFDIEVTFYFDVFTKEILAHHAADRRGSNRQYIDGLQDVMGLLKGCGAPVVLHTDQGSVYASMSYNELIKDSVIVRSMSRAGKPTDNPVNESLNGWIKDELFIDFKISEITRREEFIEALDKYVEYFNNIRPCYSIGYDTPYNYNKRYYRGELPKRDTFETRKLDPTPKFVRKRKEDTGNQ